MRVCSCEDICFLTCCIKGGQTDFGDTLHICLGVTVLGVAEDVKYY